MEGKCNSVFKILGTKKKVNGDKCHVSFYGSYDGGSLVKLLRKDISFLNFQRVKHKVTHVDLSAVEPVLIQHSVCEKHKT